MTVSAQLTKQQKYKIDAWVKKFPKEHKRSAVIMALRVVQEDQGWLSDVQLNAVAEYLALPVIAVYEVASFYSMYNRKPVGKYQIKVCASISCHLCGSKSVVNHLAKQLKIKPGETTQDNLFTLQETECLAACAQAPAMIVNDKTYYGNLSPEKIDDILLALKAEK